MVRFVLALLVISGIAGCAPWAPAPVEDRSRTAPPEHEPRVPAITAPPLYEVQRGDTLYAIAFRYGIDWRDLARWNDIDAPYTIRPGQELRLIRPADTERIVARRDPLPRDPVTPRRQPEPQPETQDEAQPEPAPEREPVTEPAPRQPPPAEESRAPAPAAAARSVRGVEWQWPTAGRVARPFDAAATRRGIGIAGSSGQPVHAAAAGEVVYSGTALIGYGELIIIKHSDTLLSAYGHNRVRLVEEGDRVSRGQPIAEMGLNDRNEEMLHFEIRRNGQPEDPLGYLPRR